MVDVLSIDDAKKRSEVISNISYNLKLFFKKKSKTYNGICEILFSLKESNEIRIDFTGSIKSLKINGKEAEFEKQDHRILIKLKGGKNSVEIDYENEYSVSGDGLHHFSDPEDGNEYLYSNFEPFDAHKMFPCFDQPDLKATYRLTVESPKDWTVISNSPEEKSYETNSTKTTEFTKTKLFSTYLFHLSAGNYFRFEAKHRDLNLSIYCRQSLKKYVIPEEIFNITKQGLDFYSDFFDFPYPFEKYDQLFVPEFNSGAMENPGAITFSEHLITRHKPIYTERSTLANVILHEMVHMWFGDLVTMKWWNDLWLNESFADFFSYFGMVKATEFKDAWQNFYSRKSWAYYQDQLITTHPIATDASDTDIAFTNFDGISYSKGASVLKQLMKFLGEDSFKKGIRIYFKKYQWKNTELRDFLDCIAESSGRNLENWFKLWIETTGLNLIEHTYEVSNGRIRSFQLKQSPSTENKILRPHKTEIALFYNGSGKIFDALYENETMQIDEITGYEKPDFVFLNYNDHDYVKDALDNNSINYVLNNYEKINDSLTRQMVLGSLWQMMRDAKFDPKQYLDFIFRKSSKEENLLILEIMFARVSSILRFYLDDKNYNSYSEQFYNLGWENVQKDIPKENKDAWLSLILYSVAGAKSADRLVDLLESKTQIEKLDFNQEKRWHALYSLSIRGYDINELLEKEKKKDPSDLGKKSAFEIEVGKPADKDKYWKLFLEGKGYSVDYLRSGMGAFYSRTQKESLRKYIALFFENIEKVFENHDRVYAKAFFRSFFPELYIEKQTIEEGESRLKDSMPHILKQSMMEYLDEMKRKLKVKERFN